MNSPTSVPAHKNRVLNTLTKLFTDICENHPDFMMVVILCICAVLFAFAMSFLSSRDHSYEWEKKDKFMRVCQEAGVEGRKCRFMYLYPNYQGGAPCK